MRGGHNDLIMSVAVAPDGQTLASASYDRTIKLWHLPDGALIRTLASGDAWVLAVAFSPDGQTLASGSADGTVKVWRV